MQGTGDLPLVGDVRRGEKEPAGRELTNAREPQRVDLVRIHEQLRHRAVDAPEGTPYECAHHTAQDALATLLIAERHGVSHLGEVVPLVARAIVERLCHYAFPVLLG